MLDSKYLQAIVDYEINIEFCEKIVGYVPAQKAYLSYLKILGLSSKELEVIRCRL